MVLTEICHVTELDPALFVFEAADTVRTPDAGTSTASRQTVMTGEAARRVGEKLKQALSGGKTIADLEGQEFWANTPPRPILWAPSRRIPSVMSPILTAHRSSFSMSRAVLKRPFLPLTWERR